MPRGSRIRFAHQVLILQIGVVLLVAVTGYGLAAWVLRNELRHQYGQRALTLARTVAANPGLGDIAAAGDPRHVMTADGDVWKGRRPRRSGPGRSAR